MTISGPHSILIILQSLPHKHDRVLHDSPLVVSQEIAIVVVQSFVCRSHFVHFQTFMAVKLLLFRILRNIGSDFFALETYPFISDDSRFQVDGAKSSIINLQSSTVNHQPFHSEKHNFWLSSSQQFLM